MKQAEELREWERQQPVVEDALGCALPTLLGERLSTDGAVWCHHALGHARVYLACVHGKVERTIPYTQTASVAAAHHGGRPGPPQWRALTAFLEHLQSHGYIELAGSDGRVAVILVTADLQHPPARGPDRGERGRPPPPGALPEPTRRKPRTPPERGCGQSRPPCADTPDRSGPTGAYVRTITDHTYRP